jgi:hypothetical protein
MKKVLILLFLILAILKGYAQHELDIISGFTVSNLKGVEQDVDTSPRFSWHGGVYGGIQLSKSFLIKSGLIYTMAGVRLPEESFRFVNSTQKMDYLDLPVLVTYRLKKFRFQAGPQFSFLIRASFEDQNIKEEFKNTYTGIRYGVSFYVSPAVTLQLHGTVSLTELNANPPPDQSITTYNFSVGFNPLRKE